MLDLALPPLEHTQALGCYTDCHTNTFCSNDPFSVSCYTVTNANHCFLNPGSVLKTMIC